MVGVPDPIMTEVPVAFVQAKPGVSATEEELIDFCVGKIASYKVPRDFVLVDEIVRSPAGKPDYRWAKETATNALGGATQ